MGISQILVRYPPSWEIRYFIAFQIGDGWTHCIMPTSATLIAALGVARIPYGLWLKFIF
ncbi:hypothetical protein, partial [Francisella tularensis]|uniref:hypothetical protein n=1 Tax=Francisella tularensis TaxID=263 RepID=UPI002D7FF714